MLNGNARAEDYLHRALLSEANNNVLNTDYDKQTTLFKEKGLEEFYKRSVQHDDMHEVMKAYGSKSELIHFEIPAEIQAFMKEQNLNIDEWASLYGNEFQHTIHKDILKQINREKEAFNVDLSDNPALEKIRAITVQLSNHSRATNAAMRYPTSKHAFKFLLESN